VVMAGFVVLVLGILGSCCGATKNLFSVRLLARFSLQIFPGFSLQIFLGFLLQILAGFFSRRFAAPLSEFLGRVFPKNFSSSKPVARLNWANEV